MIGIALAAIAVAVAVALEIVKPGGTLYHEGWYNVALAGLAIATIVGAQRQLAKAPSNAIRAALVAISFGAALCAFSGVASGLFGPDDRTIYGAPGSRVNVDDLAGALIFPPVDSDGATGPVIVDRQHHASVELGEGYRPVGEFSLHTVDRRVVAIEAYDQSGAHLTVTQPTGAAFLSPVLLMNSQQKFGPMQAPYDSFVLPAVHRVVKVVLFSPQQAAQLRGMQGYAGPALLFAVDDENDQPLPGGIHVAAAGTRVRVAGLQLAGTVLSYPAVVIVSSPPLWALTLGVVLVLGGCATVVAGTRRAFAAADSPPA